MKKSLGARTLAYCLPVYIVGSYGEEDKPNLMNAAWGGMCCSKPPLIAVSLQRVRQSYDNIINRQAFTINIPSVKYVKEADYVGVYSGRDENKFESLGLTPMKSESVDAPYVLEFPVSLHCELFQTVELGSHVQFIGEIKDVLIDDDCLDRAGSPDISLIDPFIYDNGSRAYHKIGDRISGAYLKQK
ncbi:MAG: flavin reductase family protein [Chloroflexota bacterium]